MQVVERWIHAHLATSNLTFNLDELKRTGADGLLVSLNERSFDD